MTSPEILDPPDPVRSPRRASPHCAPWNAGTPGVGNVNALKIQGLPATSARDRPRTVCCVAEGLHNLPTGLLSFSPYRGILLSVADPRRECARSRGIPCPESVRCGQPLGGQRQRGASLVWPRRGLVPCRLLAFPCSQSACRAQTPPLRWSFPVMWLLVRLYCLGGMEFAHAASAVGRINEAAPSQRNRLRRSSEGL